jgi:PAS domain-containing protein
MAKWWSTRLRAVTSRRGTVERLVRERLASVEAGTPFRTEQLMPSGLVMTLEVRPVPGGGWVTVCDDITGRSKLESALRLQTERIEHAVRHISHGLSMFDADERLIVCNEQYARVYGLDPHVNDRSFVGALGDNNESAAIVRSVATLGTSLGVETTAEGIEIAAQLALVREAVCTAAQGFFFSPPRSEADVFVIIAAMNPASRVA